ncbi:MAG: cell division ATP-binding protein FtsE [Candidatus Niyogibacteria bacterium CG10_big_fil_rev_8_21_14_0_10_46_36]|uniref:Cell division ATP-binding protein FtsE n=1 Tax=Candidatus Niyogibacteria bacterium CG10_big_fil_rev_8_21_14_0_10_46_36 TaxID=1974726 RepID=A0A2H0TCA6_9BACT|nr:MAG: cell division ATP-binding protein FtsE [Candidatus Niyogibacteria bacterium CG10_big_fil_rev_8_21_14_0_10_46_36]
MIFFDHVSKVYSPTSTALEDVSFRIEPREFVSIVGQSGAGKSTLLKLLLAEDMPSEGRVFFEDIDVHSVSRSDLPVFRRKIGTVFQDFKLLPSKTAFENVAFAMEAAGASDEDIETDVPQVLELVGLIDKAHHFPHELSGGEKQRVSIARAIVNRPDLIIADEPTGNLDPTNTHEIIELLKKINSFDTTVIMATHNRDIVNALERRVITLEGGRITRDAKKGKYIL